MIFRNEKNKLNVRKLDMAVMFDKFFMECKTEREINWLEELMQGYIEQSSEDALRSIIGDGPTKEETK